MKKIIRRNHSPFELLSLVSAFIGFIFFIKRNINDPENILQGSAEFTYYLIAAGFLIAFIAILIVNTPFFLTSIDVTVLEKEEHPAGNRSIFYLIVKHSGERVEVTSEMFADAEIGNVIKIRYNLITKTVEQLEILS